MYITRQDRTDEANLGPGLLELGKATGDGTYLSTVARDLSDPVGDSSSAFLTGSWSGVGVGV